MGVKSLQFEATIAAVATPPGEGGIAVIRLSGKKAHWIAETVFRLGTPVEITALSGYATRYGFWIAPETGEPFDDGLLTVFRAPHSYTGEDAAELSCHGGRASTSRALEAVIAAGARLAEPGEFTQRAFLNGKLDLAQAEAVADLIRARTESARRVAQRQLTGTLSQALQKIREELVGVLASIEVTIDFSEEVGELDYSALLLRIEIVQSSVQKLVQTSEYGRILREGLRVAIVGRPNVGKSSLLNALLKSDRAIVTEIAGTTRDTLEETANLGGVPVTLVDTAGLRETEDQVERIGVERARAAVETAEVTLLVLSAEDGVTPEDLEIAENLGTQTENRLVVVLNKSDVSCSLTEISQAVISLLAAGQLVCVSARTGAGLDALERAILSSHSTADAGSSAEEVVVSSVRHRTALEQTLANLQYAAATASAGMPGDFIVIDVRGALDALGQITGETAAEEIIHRIFHDFCVGK